MAEEIVDYYNENLEYLGQDTKTAIRKRGDWCKSIHCWIVRPSNPGYVLFQKRGAQKKIFPNALDISAAGHYLAGENLEDGVREIAEELNVDIDFSVLVSLGLKLDVAKVGENIVHEFCYCYFLEKDTRPEDYELAVEEVEGLVEISIPDGLALFSGDRQRVLASGIEYDSSQQRWLRVSLDVGVSHFIPRVDNYYYRIFVLADRFLRGEKHLVI